jgi:acetyl esterase
MRILEVLVCGVMMLSMAAAATAQNTQTAPVQYAVEIGKTLEPTRKIVFKRVAGRELMLHVFEPEGLKPGEQRPTFVAFYGGGWAGGEPRRFYAFADHMAKLGMIAVCPEYRVIGVPKGTTPFECVKDGRSALRYLRAHAAEMAIDPQRIVAAGGSAGAHVAAGTALFDGLDEEGEDTTVSCVPNALVLYYPVIDCSTEAYGNAKCGEHWRDISPLHRVHPGLPPTILFHGTGDAVCPFKGAQAFQEAMVKAGNQCELVVKPGGRHGYLLYTPQDFEESMNQTETFLRRVGML